MGSRAFDGDERWLAHVDWQITTEPRWGDRTAVIAWIDVEEGHRRGVATRVLRRVAEEFLDRRMVWGYATKEGELLRRALESQTRPEHVPGPVPRSSASIWKTWTWRPPIARSTLELREGCGPSREAHRPALERHRVATGPETGVPDMGPTATPEPHRTPAASTRPDRDLPALYTPRDLRLADAAEAAVRRGEAGALDHPERMPACTLQHLAFAFMVARPPVVHDPRQVIDLLEAYRARIHPHLPDHDGSFGRALEETTSRLEGMEKAAEIPAAAFEHHLETKGWTSLGRFGPNLNGWIRHRSGRPQCSRPDAITCLVPLEGPTWDSAIGTWRYDRPQRALDALVAIGAAERRTPLAVLAELRLAHEAVVQHQTAPTAEVGVAIASPGRRPARSAAGELGADLINDDLLTDQALTSPAVHEPDAGLQLGM